MASISRGPNWGPIEREMLPGPHAQMDRWPGSPQSWGGSQAGRGGGCWESERRAARPWGRGWGELTSLVSVLNLRFWIVLLSWMLFSNFII